MYKFQTNTYLSVDNSLKTCLDVLIGLQYAVSGRNFIIIILWCTYSPRVQRIDLVVQVGPQAGFVCVCVCVSVLTRALPPEVRSYLIRGRRGQTCPHLIARSSRTEPESPKISNHLDYYQIHSLQIISRYLISRFHIYLLVNY